MEKQVMIGHENDKIYSNIGNESVLFTRQDFNTLYEQLEGAISKKSSLPNKPSPESNGQEFDAFFTVLRKKRNLKINEVLLRFAQLYSVGRIKRQRKQLLPPKQFEGFQIEEEIPNETLQIQEEMDQPVEGVNQNQPNYFMNPARKFSNRIRKLHEEGRRSSLIPRMDFDSFNFKDVEKEDSGPALNNDDHNNVLNFLQPDYRPSQEKQPSANIIRVPTILHDKNDPAQKEKYMKQLQEETIKSNLMQLREFYTESDKNEAIFFKLMQRGSEYKAMAEKLVSNSGEPHICSICLLLPLVPLRCEGCKMLICAGCAFACRKNRKVCPICCVDPWVLKKPEMKELSDILLSQFFYCEYKQSGCQGTYGIDQILEHEQSCSLKTITCSQCKQLVLEKNTVDHENTCEYKLINCSICSFEFPKCQKDQHDCIKTTVQKYADLRKEFQEYQRNTEDVLLSLKRQCDIMNSPIQYKNRIPRHYNLSKPGYAQDQSMRSNFRFPDFSQPMNTFRENSSSQVNNRPNPLLHPIPNGHPQELKSLNSSSFIYNPPNPFSNNFPPCNNTKGLLHNNFNFMPGKQPPSIKPTKDLEPSLNYNGMNNKDMLNNYSNNKSMMITPVSGFLPLPLQIPPQQQPTKISLDQFNVLRQAPSDDKNNTQPPTTSVNQQISQQLPEQSYMFDNDLSPIFDYDFF